MTPHFSIQTTHTHTHTVHSNGQFPGKSRLVSSSLNFLLH